MPYDYSAVMCKCGCGESLGMVSRTTHYRIQGGYANAGWKIGHRGNSVHNPKWRGGTAMNSSGYRLVRDPLHRRKSGYILEHRLIMEQHIGRPLTKGEVIHHKNGNKTDNRIDNLELLDALKHRTLHDPNISRYVFHPPKTCLCCGKQFVASHGNYKRSKYCSTVCRNTSGFSHPRRKVNKELVDKIRSSTLPSRKAAIAFGLSATTIKRIRKCV